MALIDCPECGKEVSDKAPKCPKCGIYLSNIHKFGQRAFAFSWAWPLLLVEAIFMKGKARFFFWRLLLSAGLFYIIFFTFPDSKLGILESYYRWAPWGDARDIAATVIGMLVSLLIFYLLCKTNLSYATKWLMLVCVTGGVWFMVTSFKGSSRESQELYVTFAFAFGMYILLFGFKPNRPPPDNP